MDVKTLASPSPSNADLVAKTKPTESPLDVKTIDTKHNASNTALVAARRLASAAVVSTTTTDTSAMGTSAAPSFASAAAAAGVSIQTTTTTPDKGRPMPFASTAAAASASGGGGGDGGPSHLHSAAETSKEDEQRFRGWFTVFRITCDILTGFFYQTPIQKTASGVKAAALSPAAGDYTSFKDLDNSLHVPPGDAFVSVLYHLGNCHRQFTAALLKKKSFNAVESAIVEGQARILKAYSALNAVELELALAAHQDCQQLIFCNAVQNPAETRVSPRLRLLSEEEHKERLKEDMTRTHSAGLGSIITYRRANSQALLLCRDSWSTQRDVLLKRMENMYIHMSAERTVKNGSNAKTASAPTKSGMRTVEDAEYLPIEELIGETTAIPYTIFAVMRYELWEREHKSESAALASTAVAAAATTTAAAAISDVKLSDKTSYQTVGGVRALNSAANEFPSKPDTRRILRMRILMHYITLFIPDSSSGFQWDIVTKSAIGHMATLILVGIWDRVTLSGIWPSWAYQQCVDRPDEWSDFMITVFSALLQNQKPIFTSFEPAPTPNGYIVQISEARQCALDQIKTLGKSLTRFDYKMTSKFQAGFTDYVKEIFARLYTEPGIMTRINRNPLLPVFDFYERNKIWASSAVLRTTEFIGTSTRALIVHTPTDKTRVPIILAHAASLLNAMLWTVVNKKSHVTIADFTAVYLSAREKFAECMFSRTPAHCMRIVRVVAATKTEPT